MSTEDDSSGDETHSGKTMRRLLTAIVNGDEYSETNALRNPVKVEEVETVTRNV
jgi:hypothetical protein